MQNKRGSIAAQAGAATAALIVVALVAAAAATFFAWQKNDQLRSTKGELTSVLSDLEKAKADMLTAKKEASAAQKELADGKAAADQLRIDAASAKSFLEAEKEVGARLRAELALTKETLAIMGRPGAGRSGVSARPDLPMAVRVLPSQPMRVVPYGEGTAAIQRQSVSPGQPAPARASPGSQ